MVQPPLCPLSPTLAYWPHVASIPSFHASYVVRTSIRSAGNVIARSVSCVVQKVLFGSIGADRYRTFKLISHRVLRSSPYVKTYYYCRLLRVTFQAAMKSCPSQRTSRRRVVLCEWQMVVLVEGEAGAIPRTIAKVSALAVPQRLPLTLR